MDSHRVERFFKPVALLAGAALLFYALDYLIVRPIPMADVSEASEYSNVIGKRFRTQHELLAIGITVDRNYRKHVDYINLVPPPGFSGPEVVTKERLGQGALLEVTGILKADSFLISRIEYVVRRMDVPKASDAPTTVSVDLDSNRNFGLDEAIYVLVE
jgi:hypothetical protein